MTSSRPTSDLTVQTKRLLRARPLLIVVLLINGFLVVGVPLARSMSEGASELTAATNSPSPSDATTPDAANPAIATVDPVPAIIVPQHVTTGPIVTTPSTTTVARPSPAVIDPAIALAFRQVGESAGELSPLMEIASANLAGAARRLAERHAVTVPIATGVEPAATTTSSPALILINPTRTGGPVHYLVDDVAYSLEPGQSRRIAGQRQYLVRFHRGGQFGEVSYTLASGNFAFQVSSSGWDISEVAEVPGGVRLLNP